MTKFFKPAMAIASLAFTLLFAAQAFADVGYGTIRPRLIDDHTGGLELTGAPPRSQTAPIGSAGALGNRMGTFSVPPSGVGYIRAGQCFLSQTSGNTNRNTSRLDPVAGPYPDGTYVWQLASSGAVEDRTSARCYFNSATPGFFSMAAFGNGDNVSNNEGAWTTYDTTAYFPPATNVSADYPGAYYDYDYGYYRSNGGYFVRTYMYKTVYQQQLGFLTGEMTTTGQYNTPVRAYDVNCVTQNLSYDVCNAYYPPAY